MYVHPQLNEPCFSPAYTSPLYTMIVISSCLVLMHDQSDMNGNEIVRWSSTAFPMWQWDQILAVTVIPP